MKCTLVVSQHQQKAVCKSRPGNLLSSAWCFWIVHECAYHVQAKDGFQLLCLNGRFSKIRSQIETSYGVLRRKRRHLISSPNEQFTSDEDFDILPDIPNNDTNHSEVQLQPTQNGTVYTHSGRASRPPKRYIENTN